MVLFNGRVRAGMKRFSIPEVREVRQALIGLSRAKGLSLLDIRDISGVSLRTIHKDLRLVSPDRIEPSFNLKLVRKKAGGYGRNISGVRRLTFKSFKVKLAQAFKMFNRWIRWLLITNRRLTKGQLLTLVEAEAEPP